MNSTFDVPHSLLPLTCPFTPLQAVEEQQVLDRY